MSRIIKSYTNVAVSDDSAAPNQAYTIKPKTPKPQIEITEENFPKLSPEKRQVVCESLLSNAKQQADQIIQNAQAEIRQQIREATDRLQHRFDVEVAAAKRNAVEEGMEEGKKQGYIDGYNKGYEDGLEKADELSEKTISFMHSVIEGIDDGKHALLKRYQEDLKELALTVAYTIIRKELEIEPQLFENIIQQAAQDCKNQDYIRVMLSSNSYKLFAGSEELAEKLKGYADEVKFVVDATLKDTDCLIETPVGVIDAGVDTQLENLEAVLKDKDMR